jgi:hypothetical protein
MEEISFGFFPDRRRSDWPALDWREANRRLPIESLSRAKFTPPLQRLHTPSKRTIGRESVWNSSWEIVLQSIVVVSVADNDDDDVDDEFTIVGVRVVGMVMAMLVKEERAEFGVRVMPEEDPRG